VTLSRTDYRKGIPGYCPMGSLDRSFEECVGPRDRVCPHDHLIAGRAVRVQSPTPLRHASLLASVSVNEDLLSVRSHQNLKWRSAPVAFNVNGDEISRTLPSHCNSPSPASSCTTSRASPSSTYLLVNIDTVAVDEGRPHLRAYHHSTARGRIRRASKKARVAGTCPSTVPYF
jgi:hypothetical protein